MQFKGHKSKNFKKLKEIAKNKNCLICSSKMKNTGDFIWDINRKDCTQIKCINCLTMYSSDFSITTFGIPTEVGYS